MNTLKICLGIFCLLTAFLAAWDRNIFWALLLVAAGFVFFVYVRKAKIGS